ncbi:hypothetical protein F5144DRAFT_398381 [Chaetomium tenue]|uniref:Uncharacterized protein n=1 Tax=Chaetomium tenue TaxID=1854479 RepID=A0ACB7NTS0_9PEZI|nr:hypothetical protein F5144DRAFT_398381 [Chaetomium globosum]
MPMSRRMAACGCLPPWPHLHTFVTCLLLLSHSALLPLRSAVLNEDAMRSSRRNPMQESSVTTIGIENSQRGLLECFQVSAPESQPEPMMPLVSMVLEPTSAAKPDSAAALQSPSSCSRRSQ